MTRWKLFESWCNARIFTPICTFNLNSRLRVKNRFRYQYCRCLPRAGQNLKWVTQASKRIRYIAEANPNTIHCSGIPYRYTLSKCTQCYYSSEVLAISKQCGDSLYHQVNQVFQRNRSHEFFSTFWYEVHFGAKESRICKVCRFIQRV